MISIYKGFHLEVERHRKDEIFYEAWRVEDNFDLSFGEISSPGETVWGVMRCLKWEVDHYFEYPEFYEGNNPQAIRHRV